MEDEDTQNAVSKLNYRMGEEGEAAKF